MELAAKGDGVNADTLKGQSLADVVHPDQLRAVARSAVVKAGATKALASLSDDALEKLGRECLRSHVVTAASYSPKKRTVQVAVKCEKGAYTLHLNQRDLRAWYWS